MILYHSFTFSPFSENTYILWDADSLDAVVIDPGAYEFYEQEELRDFITDHQLKLQAIWLTHAHLDHVFGCKFLMDTFGVQVYMHPSEKPVLADVPKRCELWNIPKFQAFTETVDIAEGQILKIADAEFKVLFVPGHAPGHVGFYLQKQDLIFSGDVLFRGSVGRTDFPLCSHADLVKSINTQLYTLPEATKVCSGHGPETSIGYEMRHNPYVKA